MAEVATAYVSILPSFKGTAKAIETEVDKGVDKAADSPSLDKAGGKAGTKFGKGMGAKLGGMGKSIFGGLAVAGIGAAAAGVTSFLTGAVTSAGDLEQSQGAVKTVFEDSAGTMNKWSKGAAQAVGLTQNEFNTLGTLIGTQLKNGGTAMDQLAPKTNELIGLGADLSSMFGGTTSEAVAALSSALKGERDPIEAFGVSLSQAKIDAKAAELGFKKTGGSLSAEANQAATLALIMDQTADAHGNFAKESDTLQGQQQRTMAGFEDFKATLGTALLPTISEVMGKFNEFVKKLQPVAQWMKENPSLVTGVVGALAALAVVLGIVAVVQWAVNLAMFANPVTWIVVGVIALIAALVLLIANWDTVLAWLKGVWAGIVAWLAGVWESIKTGIATAWNAIASFFASTWETIRQAVTDAWNAVISWLASVWETIKSAIVSVFMWILNFYISIWSGIIGGIVAAWNWVIAFLAGVWRGILSAVRSAWNGIIAFFTEVFGRWKNMFSTMATNIGTAIGKIVTFFKELPGKVMGFVSSLPDKLKTLGGDLLQGLIDGIKGMAGKVVKAITGAVGDAINGAKKLLGIGSPSKVFRDIGINTGKGFNLGIADQRTNVTRALNTTIVRPTRATAEGLSGLGSTFPSSMTLVDEQGGILTRARVVVDGALAGATRQQEATRATQGRFY